MGFKVVACWRRRYYDGCRSVSGRGLVDSLFLVQMLMDGRGVHLVSGWNLTVGTTSHTHYPS